MVRDHRKIRRLPAVGTDVRRASLFLLAPLLLVPGAGQAVGQEAPVFTIEPEEGVTFSHTGELAAGSEVFLELMELPRNQRFLAYRCGPQCTTAKEVFATVGENRDLVRRSFSIEKTARHYFWVQRRTQSGEVGPVPILDVRSEDGGFLAVFQGGAMVRGSIRPPDPDRGPADPAREQGTDSVRILAVSPQPLTRGVPTEITVDVEANLVSRFEGSLSVGVNRNDPVAHRQLESRTMKGGTQQFTFVLEVVPVDWGERGQFSINAVLLPPTTGAGPVVPLARDLAEVEVVP